MDFDTMAEIETRIEEKQAELGWIEDLTAFEQDELEDEIDDLYETLKELQINIILKNEGN